MDWTGIFSSSIGTIVDSVGNTIDRIVTSDEERLRIKVELAKLKSQSEKEVRTHVANLEKEVTARWKSDNEHFITRLVRPLMVVWITTIFTVILFADGNIGEFAINPAYIPVLETIMVTIYLAYFGSRGIEKTTKLMKGVK